jgi:NADPH-dependent 2,4-dienoyl-CoA reductase/sulfur reductase-like enzyme
MARHFKSIYDVIVIGAGPGGLAAAISARKNGADDVLLIDRDLELGGILLQCIHNGFGVETFKEDLPGPSYAQRFINDAREVGIQYLLDTMVLDVTPGRKIFATGTRGGVKELEARAIVMAMGCRERTRGQIGIPGSRPAGVYTAGLAQRWVNVEGYMPGERFVILGSGDIGMIMARRLVFEGARVERVLEVMPYLTGLSRNYVQCLLDLGIPLQLNHTVQRIIGKDRVEAVEVVRVDDHRRPVPGTEEIIPCDTLLLSVGLIPENELSLKAGVRIDPVTKGPFVDDGFATNVPGVFAAGNVVHVYDLVDWVTRAGWTAGKRAAFFARGLCSEDPVMVPTVPGDNIRYVIPHRIDPETLTREEIILQMRVARPIEETVQVRVTNGETLIAKKMERYVRPGEMLSVHLRGRDYEAVRNAKELRVSVAPVSAP